MFDVELEPDEPDDEVVAMLLPLSLALLLRPPSIDWFKLPIRGFLKGLEGFVIFGWFEVTADEAELEKVRKCVEEACDPADCRRTLRLWPPWWLLFEAVALEEESPLEVDIAELR